MIILRRKSFTLENPEGNQGEQMDVPTDGGNDQSRNVPQPSQLQSQAQQTQKNLTNEVTSRQLLLQQMRLQKQLIQNQTARNKLQQQEKMSEMKRLSMQQKQEDDKSEKEKSNNIKIKKTADETRKMDDNTSLYKTKSKTVPPVGMPFK